MSSEMRELLKKYETRLANFERLYGYNEQAGADARWNRAHMLQCRDIVDDLRALLARTEARADGGAPICLFDATNPCDGTCGECHHLHASPKDAAPGADGAVAWIRPDGVTTSDDGLARHWASQGLQHRPLVYGDTHPQDASGDAVDWKWQYRFQTVMRFMDNGATREAAERAALIDIAALESAAMQAKEAK